MELLHWWILMLMSCLFPWSQLLKLPKPTPLIDKEDRWAAKYKMRSHLRFYPWANCCGPWGRNFWCLTDFPKVKLPRGNFHGDGKKNKRITHDSSRGKFYGLNKTQSGSTLQITRKWNVPGGRNHVLFTCYVRLDAKSYAKVEHSAGFWALPWMFFRILR